MYGERVGARLALQTVDVSPADLLRLIKAVPEHSVGLDLHPSGLLAGGYSPAEAAERLGAHVLHVHACDAVRGAGPRGTVAVELGRGEADFPAILGQLTEFDYRGWVTIERRESADRMTEIGNAVAYLRAL
jgi:sugar phosphate isomerase/epimerase